MSEDYGIFLGVKTKKAKNEGQGFDFADNIAELKTRINEKSKRVRRKSKKTETLPKSDKSLDPQDISKLLNSFVSRYIRVQIIDSNNKSYETSALRCSDKACFRRESKKRL